MMLESHVAGTTVVALDGEFDVSQRTRLDDAFAAALGSSLVILDLERTSYFDSTVLSCLMQLQTSLLDRGGQLILVRVPKPVHRLLENCGLIALVDIRDGLGETETERAARGGGLRRIELIAGTH
jgi:anti-anti-sigma factor